MTKPNSIAMACLILGFIGCAGTSQRSPYVKSDNQESASNYLRNKMRSLAAQIAEQPLPEKRPTIAVVDFGDTQNKIPAISQVITESLIGELFKSGKFVLVERKLLAGVLDQQKLNVTGLINEATARKVGKLLGADYIVTGSLINIGDVLNVNARLISIESASIEATGNVDINKGEFASWVLPLDEAVPGERSPHDPHDLPPAEGSFTQWKPAIEFGNEMDAYWKNGYYPTIVNGRNTAGTSEFRAMLRPFPKRTWWFYYWFDQIRSSYEDHRKNMLAQGFREIYVQVFTDSDGMKKYQTCWIKYGS